MILVLNELIIIYKKNSLIIYRYKNLNNLNSIREMTRGKESEKHKLIKEYGKLLLNDEFQIPKEYIYEEFTIGSIKYDLLVYPPLDIKDIKIFGIECGTKKSSKKKIKNKIK